MHAALVGIDNNGKSAIARRLQERDDFTSLHLTMPDLANHPLHPVASAAAAIVAYGEGHQSPLIAGLGYLLHLPIHYAERRMKQGNGRIILEREPIVDTLCHVEHYFSAGHHIKKPLRLCLETFFPYPDRYVHLMLDPAVAMARLRRSPQLHENQQALESIALAFERELFALEKQGMLIVRIDTTNLCLDATYDRVKHELGR